jgi:hypothetical protein
MKIHVKDPKLARMVLTRSDDFVKVETRSYVRINLVIFKATTTQYSDMKLHPGFHTSKRLMTVLKIMLPMLLAYSQAEF